MEDNRICMRVAMILKRHPERLNLTFDVDGSVALTDLIENVPLFTRRDVTVETLTTALTTDPQNRFVITDGKVKLAVVA